MAEEREFARDGESQATDASAFRQQVRLAAVQVAGLSADELAQALAYEVEPFSGIPVAEAEVHFTPVVDADPTVRVYDVSVTRRRRRTGGDARMLRLFHVALVAGGALLALMALDAGYLTVRSSTLTKTVVERRPLQQKLDQRARAAQALRTEAASIRSRREEAVAAQGRAARLRLAPAEFLDALATACGSRAVVKTIAAADEPAKALRVSAVGVSTEAAAEVMRQLATATAAKGWRILPGAIVAAGAAVSFDFGVEGVR